MAAVASRDGDRVGRGTGEAEASEQRQQENGGIPQEGTKEHMSVVEVRLVGALKRAVTYIHVVTCDSLSVTSTS